MDLQAIDAHFAALPCRPQIDEVKKLIAAITNSDFAPSDIHHAVVEISEYATQIKEGWEKSRKRHQDLLLLLMKTGLAPSEEQQKRFASFGIFAP